MTRVLVRAPRQDSRRWPKVRELLEPSPAWIALTILDSGEHFFYDELSFLSIPQFPSPRSIFVGDDRLIPAIG